MQSQKIINTFKQIFNKMLFIPSSFFDVRSVSLLFIFVFIADLFYKLYFTDSSLLISILSAMFYPIILAIVLFTYSKILANLKKDLMIPRKWVNFGMAIVIMFIVGEKLVYDFVLKDTGNIQLVMVVFVSIITFVFTSMMNMWMKISDKNLKAIQDIADRESLYRVLYDYSWQWLSWMNKVSVDKENIRTFIKNFHVQEGASFFDNYLALTPYVVSYGSRNTIREYNNIMLQIVEMNNIRSEIITKGYAGNKNLELLSARRADSILALELLMVKMKTELTEVSEDEQNDMLILIRAREEMITLKDKVLF